MGLLTRVARKAFYKTLALVTCNTLEVGQVDDAENETALLSAEKGSPSRWIQGLSMLFDVLDLMNGVLDMVFVVRLYQLPDSIVYASLLLAGLILGRLVVFRATTLMFRGGIDWSPFWIDVEDYPMSLKNRRAFALLYCLMFSEAALFLFEDYPSLVVYAHWPVINFPPAPLDTLDNYNVAISAASLGILMALFLVAIAASLYLMQWKKWDRKTQIINAVKIAVFLTGCAFLLRYVIQILIGAVEFAFHDRRQVPSNKILGIPLCDSQTMSTRYELCDERIFIVKVTIAWVTASIFSLYLFLRPATFSVETESQRPWQSSRTWLSNRFSSRGRSRRDDDVEANDDVESGRDHTKHSNRIKDEPDIIRDSSLSPSSESRKSSSDTRKPKKKSKKKKKKKSSSKTKETPEDAFEDEGS